MDRRRARSIHARFTAKRLHFGTHSTESATADTASSTAAGMTIGGSSASAVTANAAAMSAGAETNDACACCPADAADALAALGIGCMNGHIRPTGNHTGTFSLPPPLLPLRAEILEGLVDDEGAVSLDVDAATATWLTEALDQNESWPAHPLRPHTMPCGQEPGVESAQLSKL